MKKERLVLDHEFSLMKSIKMKLAGLLNKDDDDHRIIENCLIKAFADFRDKEISDIKLSSDFDRKLMSRLIEEDIEGPSVWDRLSMVINRRNIRYAMATSMVILTSGVVLQISNLNSKISSKELKNSFLLNDKQKSSIMLNDDYAEKRKIDSFLSNLKSNPNHLRLLEELEEFYLFIGKKETATQIRYTLDSVSK